MLRYRRWVAARLIDILKEIYHMRASTQHLLTAVSALATSVQTATATIKTELDNLKSAQADGDDEAVEAAVSNLTQMTTDLDTAVTSAQTAVSTVPVDPVPGATQAASVEATGRDPASGAPAGQGAVQAGTTSATSGLDSPAT